MKTVCLLALLLVGCTDDHDRREQLALDMVELTGLDHQTIPLNPASVVALKPAHAGQPLHGNTECAILTVDGRHIAVLETCEEVERRLQQR